MNAARRNGERLAADALAMMELKRFPTAALLAILAIEESGKVSIIRAILMANTDKELKRAWDDFRRHGRKNRMWPLIGKVGETAEAVVRQFAWLVADDSEHSAYAEEIKVRSAYVDRYEPEQDWHEPQSAITENIARTFVEAARLLTGGKPTSVREMELWQEHVAPAFAAGSDPFVAILDWHRAMVSEGIAPRDAERFESFIDAGVALDRTDEA